MITYQKENIANIWGELTPLLDFQWSETEDPEIKEKPTPKLDSYAALEKAGVFHVLTARDGSKLIGYCAFYLYPHAHYPNRLYAANDVVLLLPEYRHHRAGIKLLQEGEKMIIAAGAVCILWAVREWRDFSPILKRMGYHKQETMYMRNLIKE